MKVRMRNFISLVCGFIFISSPTAYSLEKTMRYTQTQSTQLALSPQEALKRLQEGNERFLSGNMLHRNFIKQTIITSTGQAPFAVILSCMDSRGPVEILLDQGIGDIFSLRVAGNVLNQDIIGSMEYATKVVGAKVVVIMGHTRCGAVEAACKSTKLGNLTNLLDKISVAVKMVVPSTTTECSPGVVDKIAKQNVINMVKALKVQSPIIDQLASSQEIIIMGAMQDVSTGKVSFFEAR